MSVASRLVVALLTAGLALTAPAIASAVDSAPRVKPRRGVRKHFKRPKKKKAKKRAGKGKLQPIGMVKTFPKGSPLWVVREAFKCALDYDEGSGFGCYVEHNAEINKQTPRAKRHLRAYQWKHFRKWAATYVLPGKQFTLLVTRWAPERISGSTRDVRIYLRSRQRDNPAPCMMRREGGVWKIYANSL